MIARNLLAQLQPYSLNEIFMPGVSDPIKSMVLAELPVSVGYAPQNQRNKIELDSVRILNLAFLGSYKKLFNEVTKQSRNERLWSILG